MVTEKRHNIANYCTDKDLMHQRALHENLNRLLWRYSMQHQGDKIDWSNDLQNKYKIYYNKFHDCYEVEINQQWATEETIYFISNTVANAAVREVIKPFINEHPDFKW